ncbi:uncharacterized protein LOC133901821 [Phragmites australis]|uniref:uncharacterized protein LOC133901821 n=1 Tax=Phragmites australis TaxID=29695 RepID=UPI002D779D38|nr:uncharacterized protein LOC133901821 [Phragmites australis]
MSAAVCGKRASSFFEDQQLPHAGSPPPSKRTRFRSAGGGSPSPPRPRGADPGFVAAIRARFPAVSLEFIEKALEECGNDLDAATKYLLNLHVESAEYNVAHVYQSPIRMSTEDQVPTNGILDGNEVAAPVDSVPCAESLPSSSTQWVEILVNEMVSASDTVDAKARASRVLEVFERSVISHIGAEALQNFQKENSVYKEQSEAVIRENTILKKAVAIQHERQKECDERNQELQQLKQLVVQYQEQVRSLEVNNYALSMHLRQAQQGNSMAGHFHRDIF